MPIVVHLVDGSGAPVVRLPDPSGGTFDHAGDFDALLDVAGDHLEVWAAIDAYGDVTLDASRMGAPLADIDRLTDRARTRRVRRGLDRLRVLAELCSEDPSLSLRFEGD